MAPWGAEAAGASGDVAERRAPCCAFRSFQSSPSKACCYRDERACRCRSRAPRRRVGPGPAPEGRGTPVGHGLGLGRHSSLWSGLSSGLGWGSIGKVGGHPTGDAYRLRGSTREGPRVCGFLSGSSASSVSPPGAWGLDLPPRPPPPAAALVLSSVGHAAPPGSACGISLLGVFTAWTCGYSRPRPLPGWPPRGLAPRSRGSVQTQTPDWKIIVFLDSWPERSCNVTHAFPE